MLELLLLLFWSFFKIGLFTFGGGYAMIPMIEEITLSQGWIASTEELYSWVGIAEGTPGPVAINMATFIGYQNAGVLGSLFATVGVILPSWIILVLIASLGSKVLQTKTVRNALAGLRPVVIGLIFVVALNLLLKNVFVDTFDFKTFDFVSLLITVIIFGLSFIKVKKAKLSPILIILVSGVLGIIFYQLF